MLQGELHRLAEQALEQMRHFADHVGQLQHLRAQRLLARESEQLAGQASGAVGVGFDLLDIVIIAVAGRVAHHHQVAMADDRGQDIVEIMRHAAGQLADRLHFGRLRNLALQFGFLAIVLEQDQHRRIAQPAKARNRQRDRLTRLGIEADRQIARHRRAARIAPHRIGHRSLILLGHQIARIDGRMIVLDPASGLERLVHRQEAAVAIDQGKAKRKQFEQGLDVGRIGLRRLDPVDQQHQPRAIALVGIDRDVDQPHRRGRLAFADEVERFLAGNDEVGKAQWLVDHRSADRPFDKDTVSGDDLAIGIDRSGEHPAPREQFPFDPGNALDEGSEEVGFPAVEFPQQQVAPRADSLDPHWRGLAAKRDRRLACLPIAPRRRAERLELDLSVVTLADIFGQQVAEAGPVRGIGR